MSRNKRNHEIAERVTPLGLTREAVEYYCAAVASERALKLDRSDIALSPIYFLMGHSIELAFKSFLRQSGVKPQTLKEKFKHDLMKCLTQAEVSAPSLGKTLSSEQRAILELLNENYRGKDFEYFGTGATSYPYFEAVREIAHSILDLAIKELTPPNFIRGKLAAIFQLDVATSSSNA